MARKGMEGYFKERVKWLEKDEISPARHDDFEGEFDTGR